ncbi:hypothetical protein ALC60_04668 [Trachymyrmex zeteki]|uniref:Uncharacterized protein n=1 Tax=Mycetomoellerius zeteki TaxID=64791 RepID=A0A151X7P1_9HYME|nr:hypothetical protein ALC60_04668 [Trachymyrmex zeteki]
MGTTRSCSMINYILEGAGDFTFSMKKSQMNTASHSTNDNPAMSEYSIVVSKCCKACPNCNVTCTSLKERREGLLPIGGGKLKIIAINGVLLPTLLLLLIVDTHPEFCSLRNFSVPLA